jgi:hypothetical protein
MGLASAAMLGVACGPEATTQGEAEADVYVLALCEEICAKYEECAPDPERYEECTVPTCVEAFFTDVDDPCFEANAELARCFTERETCDEDFDLVIDTSPDSICYDFVVLAHTCAEQHGR